MSMLNRELGHEPILNFRGRTFPHLYDAWSTDSLSVAHAKIKMLRILFNFGATILEDPECTRVAALLSGLRFKMPKPRIEHMTAEQAIAIHAQAHEFERPSIAVAQAFQFELMFRQKDTLGEWVPVSEPGMSDVIDDGMKWLRGVRWEEIDQNLTLVHVTSKRQKLITVSLRNAPMVLEELALIAGVTPAKLTREMLPANGRSSSQNIASCRGTPSNAAAGGERWADAAGVPETVRNMDSRAGAISEGVAAGASLSISDTALPIRISA